MADFPRATRLLTAQDFRAVFSRTRFKVSCRLFLVLATSNTKNHARLGLVVAKKHVPGAVQRNRVKRLIRESFRGRRARLAGADIVVLARKDAHIPANSVIARKLDKLMDELLGKIHRAAKSRTPEWT